MTEEAKDRSALMMLADSLVEDILGMSDDEILAELREEEISPETNAAEVRELFAKAAIKANKCRLFAAQSGAAAARSTLRSNAPVDLAEARRQFRIVIEHQGIEFTLAARNESEFSDSDFCSVFDDLMDLKAIPPDETS